MGRWTRKAREMAAEFQRGVDDMVRESELDDLKKQVGKVSNIGQLEQEVKNAIDPTGSIANDLKIPALDLKAPEPAPAEPPPAEEALKPIDVEQPHRPPEP
jgi:sec-independent protein translocase protein TatB